MIVELRKDLYRDETIEFIKRSEESMCIRFSELVAHDKYKFYDQQKDDFKS
jgi:hypothetical protein